MHEIYAEDLRVGQEHELGSHTVTQAEITGFAAQWDPLAIHTDPDAAEGGYFGGVIASGVHTLAVFQRLAVLSQYTNWKVIAGRAVRDLELPRPVRPGDSLSGALTIEKLDYDDRARAAVVIRGALLNQDGAVVLRVTVESLMKSRAFEQTDRRATPTANKKEH